MNEATPIMDLNIDRMRSKIHQEMAAACMPFYRRLAALDTVEEVLRGEQRSADYRQRTIVRKERKKPRQYRRRMLEAMPETRLLPAPAGIRPDQGRLIQTIAQESPGLNAIEMTERMIAKGYPFQSARPIDSMYVALRGAVKKGLVRQESPTTPGDYVRYYPLTGKQAAAPSSKHHHTWLSDAIIEAIWAGPKAGITRSEILTAILAQGYTFHRHSGHADPARHVTWALQHLADAKRVAKYGVGQGALFSRPMVTATKK